MQPVANTELENKPDLTDDQTFEQVFRMYFPGLKKFAQKYLRAPDQAGEVVQEVFVQLWEKRENLELNTSVKSYLFRAVSNRCLNQIRNQKIRSQHHEIMGSQQQEGTFEDTAVVNDLRQHLYEGIGQLPEQCARIFRLSRFEGLTYKEIAARLEISPKTVEVQMGKALKRLRTAVIAVLIAVGVAIIRFGGNSIQHLVAVNELETPKIVYLSDSSRVALNTNSKIEYLRYFDKYERRV